MPATLNPVITDAGLSAAIAADSSGLQLHITHIALGTGQYNPTTSAPGMTAMAARVEQVTVGAGTVSGTGAFTVIVRFTSWGGAPYNASELGFYAGNPTAGGVLFAVHSHPTDILVVRNGLDYVATFTLQLTRVPAGSITINVDPDSAQLLALMNLHLGAADPHPQYVKKDGTTPITGPQLGVTAAKNDGSKKFTTSEFVNQLGLNNSTDGILLTTANQTLTTAHVGRIVELHSTYQAVLPLSSTVRVGASIMFTGGVTAISSIVTQGSDFLTAPGGTPGTSYVLTAGESVQAVRNEAGLWRIYPMGARLPAGQISFFAGQTAPLGWLKLNGSLLARSAYPNLWDYAQSQGTVADGTWFASSLFGRFSSGTVGSDFRIPDMRGMFLRALDDGRGVDSGRALGSFQDHDNRSHNHTLSDPGHAHSVYDPTHAHGIADPGHIHGAWTDAQGQHNHHNRYGDAFAYTGTQGQGNNGTAQGLPPGGAGFGANWSADPLTGDAGEHAHNVGIAANGTGIGIYGAGTGIGIYGSGTGISIAANGSEARPKNVATILCVKF